MKQKISKHIYNYNNGQNSSIYNRDCLDAMKSFKDNEFDLAIVDPPYFSGPEKRGFYGQEVSPIGVKRIYKKTETWEMPTIEYFDELFRVSKNQIIWGINYFGDYQFGSGRIVWNKLNGKSSFSDCEIAYCSLHDSVRMFSYMWNGMLQGTAINKNQAIGNKLLNEERIHPTQKPVKLYEWLLQKYTNKDDTILDTHLGSGSSRIACAKRQLEFVGFELNGDYFIDSIRRFEREIRQKEMFL